MSTVSEAPALPTEVHTLGEIAAVLTWMKEQGVSVGSMQYAVDRVYSVEKDHEQRMEDKARALLSNSAIH